MVKSVPTSKVSGEHRDSLPLVDFSLIAGIAGGAGDGKIAFLLVSLAGMMISSKNGIPWPIPVAMPHSI